MPYLLLSWLLFYSESSASDREKMCALTVGEHRYITAMPVFTEHMLVWSGGALGETPLSAPEAAHGICFLLATMK